MRVLGTILLVWWCVFPNMHGLGEDLVSDSSISLGSESSAGVLTNIAGCLNQIRSGSKQTLSPQLEATVTLIDRERGLMVLQDDSAAMAVYTPLAGAGLKPGQTVMVTGDGIFPYVQALPAFPDQPSLQSFLDSFETPTNRGKYYVSRIRGYLHPPATGNYTFWVAADDAAKIYLSTDASPENMRLVVEGQIGNATHSRECFGTGDGHRLDWFEGQRSSRAGLCGARFDKSDGLDDAYGH